jgi:hypothetical protein
MINRNFADKLLRGEGSSEAPMRLSTLIDVKKLNDELARLQGIKNRLNRPGAEVLPYIPGDSRGGGTHSLLGTINPHLTTTVTLDDEDRLVSAQIRVLVLQHTENRITAIVRKLRDLGVTADKAVDFGGDLSCA